MSIRTRSDEHKPLSYRFPRPHEYANVPAGGNVTIYNFNIPEATEGRIFSMANNFYTDTYFEVYIDGMLMEWNPIERQIGAINNPYYFPEPLIVKASLRVVAYNNSGQDAVMEFLIDGVLTQLELCD